MEMTIIQKLVAILVWLLVVLGMAGSAAGAGAAKKPVQSIQSPTFLGPDAATDPKLTNSPATSNTVTRLREGEKIVDAVGEFQKSGERFTFSLQDNKTTIRVLENLSLERVARAIEDDPTSRLWTTSGVITEFKGENYLLITRAVLKPRTPAQTPARAAKDDVEKKSP